MEQPLQYIPQSRHVVPGSAALEGVSSCFVHFLSARSRSLLQMASVLNTDAAQFFFEAVPGTRPFFPEILLVSAQEKLLNTLPSAAPHHRAFSCFCLFCFCHLILLGFSKLLLGFSKLLLGFSKLLLGFSKLLLGFSKLLAWFRTLLLEDPHQQQQHTNSSSDSTKGVDPVNVIHRVHIQRSHFGAELFSYPFTMQPALIAEGGCEEGPSSWPGQPRYCSS